MSVTAAPSLAAPHRRHRRCPAGRRIAPMHGLLDVDVTGACRLFTGHEPPQSMIAFVVAVVAAAVIGRCTLTTTGAGSWCGTGPLTYTRSSRCLPSRGRSSRCTSFGTVP